MLHYLGECLRSRKLKLECSVGVGIVYTTIQLGVAICVSRELALPSRRSRFAASRCIRPAGVIVPFRGVSAHPVRVASLGAQLGEDLHCPIAIEAMDRKPAAKGEVYNTPAHHTRACTGARTKARVKAS